MTSHRSVQRYFFLSLFYFVGCLRRLIENVLGMLDLAWKMNFRKIFIEKSLIRFVLAFKHQKRNLK